MLDSLERQTYPALHTIAVDNGSTDGSRDLLLKRLGEDRVLVADRDLGFAAAVSMSLDSAAAAGTEAPWLLFVHDDLVLESDAVECLVAHATADPRLVAVGPKLLQHDNPRLLQQVGMSIDLTGRSDSGLEADELDQGQRDRPRPVLYVSTAGMLVRRDVFDSLGRFDRRYHVFRDDLDLCWRVWLTGNDVEVVPAAVGRHVRALSNYRRLGYTAKLGPRYFAERNTLATLIKCYSRSRLVVVLPLFFLVGIAKVVGFLLTRRFSDAWQTVRAWLWNLLHLRETQRLRYPVQAARVRSDADLEPMFVRLAPRLRAYVEAVADRLAGGETDIPAPGHVDVPGVPATAGRRLIRFVAIHPVFVVAAVLGIVGLVGALPVLRPGPLRGGDFAPWPASSLAFLRDYVSGWHENGGLGSATPVSPAQALLGLFGLAAFGNAWLASRLLLLGALPAAWLLALEAGRLVTPARLPRLAAATAYALSPPALAALTTGRLGGLVTVVLLPAIVIAAARLGSVRTSTTSAWRATAAASLLAAVLVAFEPPAALVLLLVVGFGLLALTITPAGGAARRDTILRVVAAAAGAFVLLLPWSYTLFVADSPVLGGFAPPAPSPAPFWRLLLLVPDLPGFPDLLAGIAFPSGGILAIVIGYPRRPSAVSWLWAVVLAATFASWLLARPSMPLVAWLGLPLTISALAYAGLLAAAFTTAGHVLGAQAFGWRQLLSIGTASAVAVGIFGSVVHLVADGWTAYTVNDPALPAFISAEQATHGPYRVLVLADVDGVARWDLTGPEGPSMLRYGAWRAPDLAGYLEEAIEDIAAHVSPAAAGRLGLANILYVYVPEGGRSRRLEAALADQHGLEPQPVDIGLVYRVQRWLPRAAFVPAEDAFTLFRRDELPAHSQPLPLDRVHDDVYVGQAPGPGSLLLAESLHRGWGARAGDARLERDEDRLVRFAVPDPSDDLRISFTRQARRTVAVVLQALATLLALSLVLRPPSFAEEVRR